MTRRIMQRILPGFDLMAFILHPIIAQITALGAHFSNNMLLQQNSSPKFWGCEDPNASMILTTSWNCLTHNMKSDAEGKWSVFIETLKGFNG